MSLSRLATPIDGSAAWHSVEPRGTACCNGHGFTCASTALRTQSVCAPVCCVCCMGLPCRVTKGMQAVLKSGCMAEGLASVQDEAAGLVVALALRPQPHEALLDTCAAPGGKALFAAARMRAAARAGAAGPTEDTPPGLVVAADISDARLRLIHGAARLWGLEASVATVVGDLRERSTPGCAPLSACCTCCK